LNAAALLAHVRKLGARAEAKGDRLRVVAPSGAIDGVLRKELAARKTELLELLRPPSPRYERLRAGEDARADELLERLLGDSSVLLAVLHSRSLDSDLVLARDYGALSALTKGDHGMPVLFFADCEKLSGALADLRRELGPKVTLVELRPAAVVQ
jgi:TubC N-terminal docking domain